MVRIVCCLAVSRTPVRIVQSIFNGFSALLRLHAYLDSSFTCSPAFQLFLREQIYLIINVFLHKISILCVLSVISRCQHHQWPHFLELAVSYPKLEESQKLEHLQTDSAKPDFARPPQLELRVPLQTWKIS